MHKISRLYQQFIPDTYTISWHLDSVEDDGLIYSNVAIVGEQRDPKAIRLHAKDLVFDQILVNKTVVDFRTEENDVLVIEHIGTGTVEILLSYTTKLTDSMHGIYPCHFKDGGVEKKLYVTQFESHHAREAFPCIDEPEAKAVFNVTLYTKPDVTALSNMPVKFTTDKETPGVRYTSYEPTPRMSTYLLAFVVGDLHKKTAKSARGIEVNLWATTTQPVESLDWGLKIATEVIDFYEDYYGVPYPLPKCDHVALPDFSAGAMENWGLITYREACMLASDTDPTTQKQYVATVIAHELAHQWFGNLVTMRWWDDLWLNESFANIMEYIALDNLYPEWNIWETFATDETPLALERDRYRDIQAVSYPINDPEEISAAFDKAIVYAKGSRLIRMAIAYAGEESFRRGLTNYFELYQYTNADGSQLWKCISDASHKDIAAFMDTWVRQPGYPLVSRQSGSSSVTQQRFYIDGGESDDLWPIPISTGSSTPEVLKTRSHTFNDLSLVLNHEAVGHFVTHHDDTSFELICEAMKSGELSVPEQLDIVYDTTLMAEAGVVSSRRLLELLPIVVSTENDALWVGATSIVGNISRYYEYDLERQSEFYSYLIEHILPVYEHLAALPQDQLSLTQSKTRAYAMSLLAMAGEETILRTATDQITHDSSLQELESDARLAVMKAAVLQADSKVVDILYLACRRTSDAALRDDIAKALCISRDITLLQKLIADLSDPGVIKPQDLPRWFGYLMKNPLSREPTWNWMCKNWPQIITMFGGDKSFDKFPQYASQIIHGDQWLTRYQEFFGNMDSPALDRTIRIGLEAISARTAWVERDSDIITSAIHNSRATMK